MTVEFRIQGHLHEVFDLAEAQRAAKEFAVRLSRSVIVMKDGKPFCTYTPTACPHCEGKRESVAVVFHD